MSLGYTLTDNVELHRIGLGSGGGDLALVDAGVPLLHVLDDEHPLVGGAVVPRSEPLVRRVRVLAHGQDVHVPVADPGHLKSKCISIQYR